MCFNKFHHLAFSTQLVHTEWSVPVYNALKKYKNIYLQCDMLVTTLNHFTESPRKLRQLYHEASFCIPKTKNVAALTILWKHFHLSLSSSAREELNQMYCLGLINVGNLRFAECVNRGKKNITKLPRTVNTWPLNKGNWLWYLPTAAFEWNWLLFSETNKNVPKLGNISSN